MAKKKTEKPAEEAETPKKDTLETRVSYLERIVGKLKSIAEVHRGEDIDGDGKVGSGKILACVMAFCLTFVGMAIARDIISWTAGDGINAGTATISTDDAGTATLTVDAITSALTWTGDLTGPNGETIDNASDGNVRITYDDDSTTLANFIIESDNAPGSISDDDKMNQKFITKDDATNTVVWVTLEAEIKDNTSTTKDSQFEIKTYCNNTQIDALTLDSEAGDTILNFGVDNATLGQLILDTVNNATNLADNDTFEIIGRADDSASNDTDYATIQLRATDVTTTTEDGDIRLQVIDGGSEITALTVSGAGLTLENGEIVDNATTDGDVIMIYDDDAATLGQLIFDTSINATNHADDDLYEIVGRGDDSASNATDFAKIQLKFVDVTSTTEDGGIALKYLLAGAEKTINIGVDPSTNQVIAPGADNEIDLGASSLEWRNLYVDGTIYSDAIDNSGAIAIGTTLSVTGATDLASTLSVEGATTMDSLTVTNATSGSTLALSGNQTTTDSTVGAIAAGTGSVVEHGNQAYHKTVITVTNAGVTLADGDDGEGVKIYDFDEGVVAIHGVLCNLVYTNSGNFNASDDDHYYVSIGTVEATDGNNDLTGTEANLIAKTDFDTAAGATTTHTNSTFLDTPDSIDGSSTALDIWLNTSVEATDNSGTNYIFATGTVTVLWSPLGDY